MQLAMLQHL